MRYGQIAESRPQGLVQDDLQRSHLIRRACRQDLFVIGDVLPQGPVGR
jgi:hypothetical protein